MQLGKFDNDRDSALHFLCSAEWSNDSTGDVSTMGKYVWRISNAINDVHPNNTEFQSVIDEWLESEEVQDTKEFRRSLVGHFLVQEFDNGRVLVLEYETEELLIRAFNYFKNEYESVWLEDDGEPYRSEYRNGGQQ